MENFFETVTTLKLFVFFAGCWRVSSLIANEKGPFYIFKRFRDYCLSLCEKNEFCKELHLYELVECEWCNSFYVCGSFFVLWLILGDVVLLFLFVCCASAMVVFGKFIVQNLEALLKLLNKFSS